ncbi:MAG: hypothetical protein NC334_09025, partial [Bacteroides sp.]|nr:hypothetical protein [Bacteroides sp.]
ILEILKQLALNEVIDAENLLGKGKGSMKKEMAIDFIISKLPISLKPFYPLFKKALNELIDKAIEYAVQKLHLIQGKF